MLQPCQGIIDFCFSLVGGSLISASALSGDHLLLVQLCQGIINSASGSLVRGSFITRSALSGDH